MITLQAPFLSPIFSVTIRNPELNDNLILDTRSKFYKAMDGSTRGYKKTPALKKHTLVFTNLSRIKALEVLNFLNDASGSEVKYIDRQAQIWRGMILTDPCEVKTESLGRSDRDTVRAEANSITLEFNGTLIAGYLHNEIGEIVKNENGYPIRIG